LISHFYISFNSNPLLFETVTDLNGDDGVFVAGVFTNRLFRDNVEACGMDSPDAAGSRSREDLDHFVVSGEGSVGGEGKSA
jgi:hypothetical protein